MSETQEVEIPLMRLPHAEGLPAPGYASDGAAGADVYAATPEGAPITLAPLARAAVPTGLSCAIPPWWEIQVRPRSGLAARAGATVINAPGTIDSDYRGEIKVLLINLGDAPLTIHRGERIAQLVLSPTPRIRWQETTRLPDTERGAGGFGSTGGAAALSAGDQPC